MADGMLQLALGVSIVGLLIIAFVSPSLSPPLSSIGEIDASSIERAVRVEGNVSGQRAFKGGSLMLTLTDGGSSLDVYLPPAAAAPLNGSRLMGRMVEASGTVQVFKGRLELAVEDPRGVRLK
jgi:DNA/RNA endonuclease YhcR with UshA esterase domain